ncbi:hypothetical protein ASG87_15685 [Frateuria sp. Soil773]|nr:hypothetical protein ASG87_15685 [Frateuria sp. Soil773]
MADPGSVDPAQSIPAQSILIADEAGAGLESTDGAGLADAGAAEVEDAAGIVAQCWLWMSVFLPSMASRDFSNDLSAFAGAGDVLGAGSVGASLARSAWQPARQSAATKVRVAVFMAFSAECDPRMLAQGS